MKKRFLILSLAAALLISSCATKQEPAESDITSETDIPAVTTATAGITAEETTAKVTTEKTTTTTAAVTSEIEITTTAIADTEAPVTTTPAESIVEKFEPVHLPRTEEVGYGDFLRYREIFDDIEDCENPRGSDQLVNIDDVIYSYTGYIPKEKSGSSVTENLGYNEKFVSTFNGEPSYKQIYSLELIGTGISTLDVFTLENLSATKEYSPYFRLSDDFVLSIDNYYKQTNWESCDFSVWQKSEEMTDMCRTVKLLWEKRDVYRIDHVSLIWLAYKDAPYYLEIDAPKDYHDTITTFLSANNIKYGYTFKTVQLPDEQPLSDYADKILREDYAKYISTDEKQYAPEDVYVLNYGGAYNGNEVVVMDLCTNSMYDYNSIYLVKDYWLEAPGDCRIFLHKNGTFMDIEDTFDTGNLTAEDLALLEHTLPKLHNHPKPVPVPAPAIPLTEEADLQLRQDYARLTRNDPDNVEVVKYFGTYGGKEVVIMYQKDAAITDDMSYTSVNGYLIAVGSGCYEISVHCYNNFYPIQQAYNQGFLTEEDIQAVVYYSQNPIVYE